MVEWINSEMERTQLTQKQLSQRRGKDMGEDVFQSGKLADGTLGLGAEVNIIDVVTGRAVLTVPSAVLYLCKT